MLSPPPNKMLFDLAHDAGSYLVEGRIGNLVGLNPWSSINNPRQRFEHIFIGSAVINFRVLFAIPQTDSHGFRSTRIDEGQFILETLLFSQQGNDFLFDGVGKVGNTIWLQMQINISSQHTILLGRRLSGATSDNLS